MLHGFSCKRGRRGTERPEPKHGRRQRHEGTSSVTFSIASRNIPVLSWMEELARSLNKKLAAPKPEK
jgi:hypothetical protein